MIRLIAVVLLGLLGVTSAEAYISGEGIRITCRAPEDGVWSITMRALAPSDDNSVSEVFVTSYDGGLRIDLRPVGDDIWTRRIPDAFCNQIHRWRLFIHDSDGFFSRDFGCGSKAPGVVVCQAGAVVP